MSDAVTRARELLDKATPGPWEAATCHESEQETRSEYVRNALLKPDAPAHGLWMAWKPDSPLGVHLTAVTGDGPHGEADAELIAAAPTLLAELADEVERLRALTTVDYAMVERAARAMVAHSGIHHPCEAGERCCEECGEAFGWFGISQAEEDLRYASHRARAALEAALGVES